MTCRATDCLRPILCRELCGLHYKRFRAGKSIHDHEKLFQSLPRGGLAALDLHKHHPFYLAWVNMKTRCNNPKSTQYRWYGARGIFYCEAWEAFSKFHQDMWEDWEVGLTLDRKDNNAEYSKGNCHWTTQTAQAANRRPRAK